MRPNRARSSERPERRGARTCGPCRIATWRRRSRRCGGRGRSRSSSLAFEFVVLTAARWGEVRGAEWVADRSEGRRVWTIPAGADEGAGASTGCRCAAAPQRFSSAARQARGRQSAGVHPWGWPSRSTKSGCAGFSGSCKNRGRAARLPVFELSGLGGRRDGSSARSHRSGAGACGPEQSRGGLSAHGPVRAPTPTDGRLGCLSQWETLRKLAHVVME